jgi:Zn ribbon nucleic-acid-binding protein
VSQPGTHKGFGLRCPFCGEEDSIRIDAHNLDEVICSCCDHEIDHAEVVAIFFRWQRFFAWLGSAPDYPGD